MKTIVVANQKGGSGKSTSTVHLAVAAEQTGDGPVLISDTDPQGTTGDWFNQRRKAGLETPRYAPLALPDLTSNLRALKDAGAAYLFIDTAPSIGSVNAELFAAADMILIPLNPTPADLRALVKGLPTIKRSGKPFNFMLARVRPNLRNNDGAAMALDALGLVLPTRMHERVIYAESFAHGKTAFEIEPKGIAATELASIWEGLKERIAGKRDFKKTRKYERGNSSMSKRPSIDLMALTSEQAAPMPEATQRMPSSPTIVSQAPTASASRPTVKTENLEALAFKVPPVFRKRFKQRAVTADLKLNELLFEALDAWEEKQGIKR